MNLILCLSKGFKSARFHCPFSGLEETQAPTHVTPALPSAQSFWGPPIDPKYKHAVPESYQLPRLPGAGSAFSTSTDSSVCSLSLVGNYFSGDNVDGQGGVQKRTKKGRRADTKTVLPDLW